MPRIKIHYLIQLVAVIIALTVFLTKSAPGVTPAQATGFTNIVIDSTGPLGAWGKAGGDLNGDGLIDLIIGGHDAVKPGFFSKVLNKLGLKKSSVKNGELVWYENPGWRKNIISQALAIRTDIETGYIDRDDKLDIIVLSDAGIIWLKNPDWQPTIIDTRQLHDLEVSDFDSDGDLDLAARGQSYGRKDGNKVHLYKQNSPKDWEHIIITAPDGEGLKVADLDRDGDDDIIINSQWFENPGSLEPDKTWISRTYSNSWNWPHTKIDIADINLDNRPDIVLTPAEQEGQFYHVSWFEGPDSLEDEWTEHIIEDDLEAVLHSVAAKDMNGDGQIDILTAEMTQSKNPDFIKIYFNESKGTVWREQIVDTNGSHNIVTLDIDNDFDIDFFGTHWKPTDDGDNSVELWRNELSATTQWRRRVIDESRPGKALFIYAEDINQDHHMDIITGAYWYENPADIQLKWKRHNIGDGANNASLVSDFDKDGDFDILASEWLGYAKEPTIIDRILRKLKITRPPVKPSRHQFVWAQNKGNGEFSIKQNIESAKGDFLQGITMATIDGDEQVLLSWHQSDNGIQSLSIPSATEEDLWKWQIVSDLSQDEQINAFDLDKDGDQDVVLGTTWLKNEGNGSWNPLSIITNNKTPDRNQIADINDDGLEDIVVGYQAISVPGTVAWYEQGENHDQLWTEHIVGTAIGPMSLDVADLDHDNDLDVIIGEHNLRSPDTARLILFENIDGHGSKWQGKVLYQGDEHHDGTQVYDIDDDGDLDILSIGWGHNRVILYENLEIEN